MTATMAASAFKTSLSDGTDIPDRNAVDASREDGVFRTVDPIPALVKGKMKNDDSVHLSEPRFKVCDTLKSAIQRGDAGDLNVVEGAVMEDLERVMGRIEGVFSEEDSSSHPKVQGRIVEVQRPPAALTNPPSNKNLNVDKRDLRLAHIDPHCTATPSPSKSACKRLIEHAHAPHEHPLSSLIEAIIWSKDKDEVIRSLPVDNAQMFIDVIDEALGTSHLSLLTQKKSLRLLYRTCGHHALLPSALIVSAHYDRTRNPPCKGGYADVWKGEYRGRDVAVKVLRTYKNRELQRMIKRFCKEVVTWKSLRHPNVLPLIGVMMSENEFAMVSDWMVNGDINEFVEKNPDADRFGLLAGVARGLIYLHTSGMVHGDLKGANVLVDETGNARLADFGLLTIISDPANPISSSSNTRGGTVRWMSPELIAPEQFGLKKSRPTRSSDCYALGMVIYETIGGRMPFHEHVDLTVFMKVMAGERPTRGVGFAENLWKTLESCWRFQPNARPSVEDVLLCLEVSSDSSELPSPGSDREMDADDHDRDSLGGSSVQNENFATTETKWNTVSPDWTHVSYDGLGPVSSTSAASFVTATCGGDTDSLGFEETDIDPFTVLEFIEEAERHRPDEQPSDPDQHLDTEGSHIKGNNIPQNDPSNSNPVHATQEDHVAVHPVRDMADEVEHHHTAQDSPVKVPEFPCRCSVIRGGWGKKPSINFFTWFNPGVRLVDALRGNLEGVGDKDDFPFDVHCSTITIKMRFPGYASSTAVEKRLKAQRESEERVTARSMQISTKNSDEVSPGSITKRELVRAVSKCIRRYIRTLEENVDLFPFDGGVSECWRLGKGKMKLKYMVITRLDNVYPGCWSPVVYIDS